MQGSGINLIITTKSNLVTRDIDLIKTYPNPLVAWSINTLDEEFKKDIPVKKDDKHFKWWYLIIIILIGVLIGVLLISLID